MRQARAAPLVTALHAWLKEQLATVSKKSVTADAIGYALNQWQALTRFLDDGRIEVDNNAAHAASGMIAVMTTKAVIMTTKAVIPAMSMATGIAVATRVVTICWGSWCTPVSPLLWLANMHWKSV